MKYTIIDELKGMDIFTETYDNQETAIKEAKKEWNRLTESDRKRRNAFYVLENESGEYGDGKVVFIIK